MIQYQWGQDNLTNSFGTTISPDATGQSPNGPSSSGQSPNVNQTGVSPDDGYSLSGINDDSGMLPPMIKWPLYTDILVVYVQLNKLFHPRHSKLVRTPESVFFFFFIFFSL